MKKAKKLLRIVFGRTAFVLLFLALQVLFLLACFSWMKDYGVLFFGGSTLLTIIVVIWILNDRDNPSFKLAWIVPVLVIPVFGTLAYLFVRTQLGTKLLGGRVRSLIKKTRPYLVQDQTVMKHLRKESRGAVNLAAYMNQYGGYPIYENTNVTYFPLGEDKFEEMKRQLEQAAKFIFLEYFIVEHGEMWDSIVEILERKAKEGVEVRVMYDGMCAIALLPYSYPKELEAKGIRCKMFSPIKPALSTHQNNRDHRKILVIDGHTGFTGGVNLADEYINREERFGHWKDTAVMLKGDAVQSLTIMFLQLWEINEKQEEDYSRFLQRKDGKQQADGDACGFVMPYADSPMDKENVGEMVYMDILYQAKRYVHIMTPYLILDNEMVTALTYSAKRGIDTVIIMPHIPDKVYAYLLARAHYPELIGAGVKIYEYTPGFVHAKVFTSDDEKAVVGTINLDFRSLYLHFECAAYLYKNPAVRAIEKDFQKTLAMCQRITLEDCRRYPFMKKLAGRVLRLFAPLM